MLLKIFKMNLTDLEKEINIHGNNKEIIAIQKELSELANLIIDDTIDKLENYFINKNIDLFKKKVQKAKNYKN
jgi:hypothetical protein